MTAIFKKAGKCFLYLILLLITAGSLFYITCCKGYRIRSGSMEPSIPNGAIVIVLREDRIRSGITEGGIYAYRKGQLTVVHRMTGRDPEGNGYVFRGDANNTPDGGFIQESQIIGPVVLILPRPGR